MRTRDTLALIERLARDEAAVDTFLAPCVRGGRVMALSNGLAQRLIPVPADFQGWGIFAPHGRFAKLVQPAHRRLVDRRMAYATSVSFILIRALRRGAWLAMPLHREAFETRFGASTHVTVQLVDGADVLGVVQARAYGRAFWFDRENRRASPRRISQLRRALDDLVAPDELRMAGLTPEWRAAYSAAVDWRLGAPARRVARVVDRDRLRLDRALRMGGGRLNSFVDRGDFWSVEWLDRDGCPQVSAIAKHDLTVINSGICLDGHDEKFDLQSLVGIFADREPWA